MDAHRMVAAIFARRRPIPLANGLAAVWLIGLVALGCTPNEPYRSSDVSDCRAAACDGTLIEQHDGYDLAYVEFTERGNVFNRKRMQAALDYISEQARYDPSQPERGVITVVFVHGWKHNAQATDENVRSFRELLRKGSLLGKNSSRKVIGVYVGWRGLSIDAGPLNNLTYWDRKTVAEQVAKGGVTELLLRLEREVIDDQPERANRNLYLVTGHSFGGAIVLSALNEILLERVVEATAKSAEDACVATRPFGHGVALLNPAIEANEVLQLKELVAETCFVRSQQRLLHVISSDADTATNKAFRLGQWFGVNLRWRQTTLSRAYNGSEVKVRESDLDTTTVGNSIPFQTGQLNKSASADARWEYRSCVGERACIDPAHAEQHIPVKPHEPLAFIHTDESFIADHNDVFNDNISAYLAAIMAEARYKRTLNDGLVQDRHLPEACRGDWFNFGACFATYQGLFEQLAPQQSRTEEDS